MLFYYARQRGLGLVARLLMGAGVTLANPVTGLVENNDTRTLLITNKQAKRYFVADRLRAAAGSGSTGLHFAERCCVFRRTL